MSGPIVEVVQRLAFPSAARSLVSLGTIILTLSIACGGGITPETIVRAIAVLPTSTPLALAKPALTPISVTLTRRPTASPVATRTEIPSPTPELERYRLSIAIVPDVSVEIALAPHPHPDASTCRGRRSQCLYLLPQPMSRSSDGKIMPREMAFR